MDRELLAQFRRASPEETATPGESGDHAGRFMTHLVERLSDHPAMVFSRFGEVLSQTPSGDCPVRRLHAVRQIVALPGRPLVRRPGGARTLPRSRWASPITTTSDATGIPSWAGWSCTASSWLDPVEYQVLLVFMAVPGSPSDEKLRLLAAAGD